MKKHIYWGLITLGGLLLAIPQMAKADMVSKTVTYSFYGYSDDGLLSNEQDKPCWRGVSGYHYWSDLASAIVSRCNAYDNIYLLSKETFPSVVKKVTITAGAWSDVSTALSVNGEEQYLFTINSSQYMGNDSNISFDDYVFTNVSTSSNDGYLRIDYILSGQADIFIRSITLEYETEAELETEEEQETEADPEPYAVLSENNTVLTFYYDGHKQTRGGMSVGPFYYSSFQTWFNQRNSITKVVFDDTMADCTSLKSTGYWFYNCQNLTEIIGLKNLNTTNVTDMEDMFDGCAKLTSLDLSGLKTDNVTFMNYMFANCSGLKSLDVSGFNTANVTTLGAMFAGCSGLTSLDLRNFNTDKVTEMGSMFSGCSSLTSLDVSNFNTSEVTWMGSMFYNCVGLTSLDISHFNTANVTSFNAMFEGCSSLTSLDLSSFNPSNVTDMAGMFYNCSNLATIYASDLWTTQSVSAGNGMFVDCNALVGGNGTKYQSSHHNHIYARIDGGPNSATPGYFTGKSAPAVIEPEPYAALSDNNTVLTFYYDGQKAERKGMSVGPFSGSPSWYGQGERITSVVFDDSFANCTTLTSTAYWFYYLSKLSSITGISNLKTDKVTDMKYMFNWCYSLTSLDVSGFKTDNVMNMWCMFSGCSGLTSLDVTGFKTDNVTNMREMFSGCSGLTSLDVTGFKTDNITNMYNMFYGCSGLTSLDLSNFNTAKITDMGDLFSQCSSLTSLDLSGFKTDNVTNMRDMFSGCSSLTSLDLSGFKTDNVTNMGNMFYGCSSLTTIYADDGWSTTKVKNGGSMFYDCTNLVGGAGTTYSADHTDNTYAHIDGGPDAPGYLTSYSSYDLWIGNILVTEKNCTDILGDANADQGKAASFQYIPSLNKLFITNNTDNLTIRTMNDEGLTIYLAPNSTNAIGNIYYVGKGDVPLTITTDGNYPGTISLSANVNVISGFSSLTLEQNLVIMSPEDIAYDAGNRRLETTNATIGIPLVPITEEKTITPKGDKLQPESGSDDINKVVEDILYTLGNANDSNGDGYDDGGFIVINSVTTDQQAIRVTQDYTPGTSEYLEGFKGLTFMIPAGKGKIAFNVQTSNGYAMKVMVGDAAPAIVESIEKGTVEIPYNVAEPTYVYVYNAGEVGGANSARSIQKGKMTTVHIKIYGTTVKPSKIKSANSAAEASGGEYQGEIIGLEGQDIETDEEIEASKGDVNGDETANIADIIGIVNALMGNHSTMFDKRAADVNSDGIVNAEDLVIIVNKILK